MDNSVGNFSTPETSTNHTTQSIGALDIVEVCTLSISFLFGVPTNVYIIWLIFSGTASGIASEFINLNLSVCETGISLNHLVAVLPIFCPNLFFIPQFLQGLNMTGRPLFQCLMCVERYLAVVHPVTFLKYKPLRYRMICCTAAWIIILGSCFYSLLIIVVQNDNARVWSFSTQFLLFFSIQMFCLLAVLRALKQSGPGERKTEKEENHMKRKAFYLILITSVTMVFIHVPFIITGYSTILIQYNVHIYWLPGTVCFVVAGFVQPVLYLHRAEKLSCLYSPKLQ